MNPYSSSYHYYPPSPSMPCIYTNFSTPSTAYCSCCYSPPPYYYQHPMPPPAAFSPPASPFLVPAPAHATPNASQFIPRSDSSVSPSTPTKIMPIQPSSTKITRLQYSSKDRYILNELFKRTPYPNGIQRDVIARQLGITQEQIRIWFQNRRRLQTQRDTGDRLATANELAVLQQGKASVNTHELKKLLNDVIKHKDAPPRLRLDEAS